MAPIPRGTTTDTIACLAEEIARASPECADKALQIAELARELDNVPDRLAIHDAIESRMIDSDISDQRVHTTTSAVLAVITDPTSAGSER